MLIIGSMNVFAYDIVVTMKVKGMEEKIIDIPVYATATDGMKQYAEGKLNETDSTFVLKNLPDKELGISFMLGGNYFTEEVSSPQDSITIDIPAEYMPKNELNEIIVNGMSRKFEDDKQVYLPSKRDKRISQDGTALLRNMAIPTIHVSDDAIRTSTGEGVSVFIDYLPASSSDITNIRTADVRNVEIYDFPQDPRFGGAQHVVNFNMIKYEYGGYTKLTGRQRFIFDQGYYALFSKFSYKKMTYDISAGYYRDHSRNNDISTDAVYDFGDEKVDYSSQTLRMYEHDETYNTAFRAVYQDSKTVISNIVGLSSDSPRKSSSSRETFSNPSYLSGDNNVSSNSDNIAVAWNGNYQFFLPKGLSIAVSPDASYARNKQYYSYSGLTTIVNDTKESAWQTSVRASISKKIGRHTLTARGYVGYSDNKIDYLGTTPAVSEIKEFNANVLLEASLSFGKLLLMPAFVLKTNNIKVNGFKNTSVVPNYNVNAIYSISPKRQLQFASCIYPMSMPLNQMGDNYQMTDQINAIKGNPDLKTQLIHTSVIQYTSFINSILSYTAYVRFNRNWRNMSPVYTPADIEGHKVMLRDIINSGFTNLWEPGLTITAKLLKNALTLRASAKGNFINQHGPVQCKKSRLEYNLQASYSFRNFYVSGDFDSKSFTCSAWQLYYVPATYNFDLGWSNGNLNVRLRMYNLFSSSYKSTVGWFDTAHYSKKTQYYHQSMYRNFLLSVTYSFSYGKKVKHDEISVPQGVQSGILQ